MPLKMPRGYGDGLLGWNPMRCYVKGLIIILFNSYQFAYKILISLIIDSIL